MAREQGEGDTREAARPHRDLTPEILDELKSISDSLNIIARAAAQQIEPPRSPLGKIEPRFEIQTALYQSGYDTTNPLNTALTRYKANKERGKK